MPTHLNPLSKSPPTSSLPESDLYLLPTLSSIYLSSWLSSRFYRLVYRGAVYESPSPTSSHSTTQSDTGHKPGFATSAAEAAKTAAAIEAVTNERFRVGLLEDESCEFITLLNCEDPEVGGVWEVVGFVKFHFYTGTGTGTGSATESEGKGRDGEVGGEKVSVEKDKGSHAVSEGGADEAINDEKPPPPTEDPARPWPPGANIPLCTWFWPQIISSRSSFRASIPSSSQYILLDIVAISPQYQRQGFGRILMDEVCGIADQRGVKCVLEASEGGEGLYGKVGFREKGVIWTDLGRWGGEEDRGEDWKGDGKGEGWYKTAIMVRDPRGKEG